jgi:hypothetical protein
MMSIEIASHLLIGFREIEIASHLLKGLGEKIPKYTVKKGSRVSRPQPGCHYKTLPGRE